jgi:hypothetical protein
MYQMLDLELTARKASGTSTNSILQILQKYLGSGLLY